MDIIIIDILEVYGILLSRNWSDKLHGYFSMDWSHLWFPLKWNPNMIRIKREKYLKHNVTDLEAPNEFLVLCNYLCDSYFGNFLSRSSEVLFSHKSKLSLHEYSKLIEPCKKPKQSFHAQSQ
jgi:hypothetical protein